MSLVPGRHRGSFEVVALAAGLLLATGARTTTQGPVFSGAVSLVPVYVSVTDASGAVVGDLKTSDFRVRDNGRDERIRYMASGIQPFTAALLVDQSPSLFAEAARLAAVANAFVGELVPDDRVTAGTFGHLVFLARPPSADRREMLLGLELPPVFPAGSAMWDAVEAGRALVAPLSGRRVVMVLTDAKDNSSRVDVEALRYRLEREGVLLYGVGTAGREGLDARELRSTVRLTGGGYFELGPADDPAALARRIASDLHHQYLLGFEPRSLDGRTHRIDVEVLRPRLTVRARRSYVASAKDPVR